VNVRAAYLLAGALCAGLASANVARPSVVPLVLMLALAGMLRRPLLTATCIVATAGWWWGGERLELLDRSALVPLVGTAARAVVEVQEPPHPGRFEIRVRARAVRWGGRRIDEPVLLELPVGRAPPQGARLSVLGVLRAPRGPTNGFDERAWLRRHGVHVVLRVDAWRRIGRRGGLGGVADRLHAWLARDGARGLAGERRAVIEGVVLGEDQGLSDPLKQRFRASGLYHLLAVSGSNVALVAAGVLGVAWIAGVSRRAAELCALAGIGAYVLAVGPQPSVIRAGVVAALGSLAWLTGRQRDRWHALLLSAVVLLARNPSTVLDPGFQLSFVAVLSIFVLAPRIRLVLEGYPVPRRLRGVVAVGGMRARHRTGLLVPVPRRSAPHGAGECGRGSGDGADARAGPRIGPRCAGRAARGRAPGLARRVVCGVPRGLRTALRRAPGRADPLGSCSRGTRLVCAPGRGLCLSSWRPS
jgi:competence protein ComEC